MAQIIEQATGDVAAVDVDVVTLDIIENALRNARYEMDEVLFRTALSPGIRELNDEALKIILNQVRMPEWNRADLNGIVAACRTAGRRVQELCDRFGTETYLSALDALLDRNYRAMKTLLTTIFADGERISFTDYICDDGVGYGPYELKLS